MIWLPDLVELSDFGGDWDEYIQRVHDQFRQDFIQSRPTLDGESVGVSRNPVVQGRESSFWHLISEGRVEEERIPDLRRCERIAWPRAIIEHADTDDVHWWPSKQRRVIVTLADFTYKLVLIQGKGYKLLLTAHPIERAHRRRKLEKEWKRNRT